MTKTAIKKELLNCTDGNPFMTVTDTRKILKCGKDNAAKLLSDVHYIKIGTRKMYLVEDVAEKLAQMRN